MPSSSHPSPYLTRRERRTQGREIQRDPASASAALASRLTGAALPSAEVPRVIVFPRSSSSLCLSLPFFSLKSQHPYVLLCARRPPWTSSSSRRRSSKSAPLETIFNLRQPLFIDAPPSTRQAVAASISTAQVRRPAARRTSLAFFLHCIPSLLERIKSPCIKHRPCQDTSSALTHVVSRALTAPLPG